MKFQDPCYVIPEESADLPEKRSKGGEKRMKNE